MYSHLEFSDPRSFRIDRWRSHANQLSELEGRWPARYQHDFEPRFCDAPSEHSGVYDVGEYHGSPYPVCELLDGETLREKIKGCADDEVNARSDISALGAESMIMELRELNCGTEHEEVVECIDDAAGYHGIIAIHSTALGPGVGGTRVWPYTSTADAIEDVLRLSRAMSYKAAAAGLDLGGGKSVIIGDNRLLDRERVFRAHGRFIEHFKGRYIAGEDVGTTPADMELVRLETRYVGGLPDKSGDPSPSTAHGVFRAMQAAARARWASDDLAGRTVAIQGCGHVGYHLALELHQAGARLILTDVDSEKVDHLNSRVEVTVVPPEAIFEVEADVFSPCALGAILNDETISRLHAQVVCGAANNQLCEGRHGSALASRGILYVPDYVANAGGIINGAQELSDWDAARCAMAVEAIYDTTLKVFALARAQEIPPSEAADRLAQTRLLRKN
jgi:leucine dehydrogenase